MPADERIKVTFKRIFVLDSADWLGSGEFYFIASVDGQRVGDTVVVVGSLPVDFTAFDVTMPAAPVVVSVEDNGDLEWQLFFSRS
jgi:hypothetical protein